MGQDSTSGEAPQQRSITKFCELGSLARHNQRSDSSREEVRSNSTSTSSPLQVTTIQADKSKSENSTTMTVTCKVAPQASELFGNATLASCRKCPDASSAIPNPQVIDMTQVRDKRRRGELVRPSAKE